MSHARRVPSRTWSRVAAIFGLSLPNRGLYLGWAGLGSVGRRRTRYFLFTRSYTSGRAVNLRPTPPESFLLGGTNLSKVNQRQRVWDIIPMRSAACFTVSTCARCLSHTPAASTASSRST